MLNAYDFDGVLSDGVKPEVPFICITGRTFPEFDAALANLAHQVPVYMRGVGEVGDHHHAAAFKSDMINMLGVDVFYEDHPLQIHIIRKNCPDCEVIQVGARILELVHE